MLRAIGRGATFEFQLEEVLTGLNRHISNEILPNLRIEQAKHIERTSGMNPAHGALN
ncbi:MAG: hypothetical protein QM715_06060 [Nibricoccus sp.]